MKLSAPKVVTFWLAVLLVVVGVVVHLADLASLGTYGIWIIVVGFILLAIGNLAEGV